MPPINTPSDAKYQDHGSTGHNTRFREPREFSDLLMMEFRRCFGTESAGMSRHKKWPLDREPYYLAAPECSPLAMFATGL